MKVITSPSSFPTPPATSNLQSQNEGGPEEPQGPQDRFQNATLTAACAATGGTTGYFLGELTGGLLSNIAAGHPYVRMMPAIGAGLGTLWGTAATRADENDALTQTVRGSATLGSGATLGMVTGDTLGYVLTGLTGSPAFAAGGALAGVVTGGLVGLSCHRAGRKDPLSRVAHGGAGLALGATSGWFLGGGTAALLQHITRSSGLSLAPTLGAVSGGLIGLAAYLVRQDKENRDGEQ